MIYFVLVALATPSPPIDATMTAQGSFCIDACCPETAIPKLVFGPDDRFGEGITVMQNNSRLTCSGEFEATDVRIAGTNTTVADLISRVAVLEGQAVGRQTMHLSSSSSDGADSDEVIFRSSSHSSSPIFHDYQGVRGDIRYVCNHRNHYPSGLFDSGQVAFYISGVYAPRFRANNPTFNRTYHGVQGSELFHWLLAGDSGPGDVHEYRLVFNLRYGFECMLELHHSSYPGPHYG